mgnify:CR=1 FL=1
MYPVSQGNLDLSFDNSSWMSINIHSVTSAESRQRQSRLLREFDVDVFGYVLSVGSVTANVDWSLPLDQLRALRDQGDLFKDFPALRMIIPHGGGAGKAGRGSSHPVISRREADRTANVDAVLRGSRR